MTSSTTREVELEAPEPEPFERLLLLVAQGDRSAFAAMYDALAPTVLQLTRRRCPKVEAVALVQEVFLQIWRRAPTYSTDTIRATSWIITVADSTIAAHLAR